MVTRLNVPPFVITLVTYTTARALSLAITSGTPINGISSPVRQRVLRLPVADRRCPTLFFFGAALIAWFVLERTYIGRQVYAVGGSTEAARLAGIPSTGGSSAYVVSGCSRPPSG